MIRAAIFDFDGTLMDTIQDSTNCMNYALTNHGFDPIDVPKCIEVMGQSLTEMINRCTPKDMNDAILLHQMGQEAEYYYAQHYNETCKPYRNIRHALKALKNMNIDLCIITNKPSRMLIPLLNEYFADIEFKHIVASDSGYPLKPNPASCEKIMQTLDVHYDEIVYIGDSEVDIQIAKNARAFSIGCGWGFRGGKSLISAGADYVIHDPMDIIDVMNILNKRSLKKIMAEAKIILEMLK